MFPATWVDFTSTVEKSCCASAARAKAKMGKRTKPVLIENIFIIVFLMFLSVRFGAGPAQGSRTLLKRHVSSETPKFQTKKRAKAQAKQKAKRQKYGGKNKLVLS